jgi:drug/metabolite transporter (DMT)-like permease
MVAPENPSVGKFGPPLENAQRERVRLGGVAKAGSALGPAALMIGIFALRSFSHSRRGWVAALAGILAAAGYGAQYIFARRMRDGAPDGGDPYTPPTNITR